jgi:antitoxin component of MazEF toxin-antitoxin module
MKFVTTVIDINGSLYMRLPQIYAQHLNVKGGDDMEILDEVNKKGQRFISAWKKGE